MEQYNNGKWVPYPHFTESAQKILSKGQALLKDLPNSSLEAKLLFFALTLLSEEKFYSEPDVFLSSAQENKYLRMVKKRLKGVPSAYLIGSKEFWSLSFKVRPGVLIPRPETELLVEKVIELSIGGEEIIADIGTGCGNIAISLAKELGGAEIYATDISHKALDIARTNVMLQGMSGITLIWGDLYMPLKKLGLDKRCDFIISNPPYVTKEDWGNLDREIRDYDPEKALVAGETGLEVIEKLVKEGAAFLKTSGYLVFEIGFGQEKSVQAMLGQEWEQIECYSDLAGISRVFTARKS